MFRVSLLGSLVLAGVCFASAADGRDARLDARVVSGHYKWVPGVESAQFFKRHHLPTPTGVVVLNPEGLFRYSITDEHGAEITLGTYSIEGDLLAFRIESGDGAGLPRRMRLDSMGLAAPGVRFVRERVVLEARAPERAPAMVAPVVVALADTPPPCPHTEIEGVWTLRTLNHEVANQRFTFLGDGTFRHSGEVTSCAGRYVVTGEGIELTYTAIDGQLVDPASAPFHKRLPLIDGRIAFLVDSYRYERSGG